MTDVPVARLASLAVPVGVFVGVLMVAWPEPLLAQAYGGGGLLAVAVALALWFAHTRRGWFGILLGVSVTLGVFAFALAALWQDVAFHYSAIGGLLPWSDAQGYYYDANRLLDGHALEWSARRPLFPAFLSVLLAVTGSLPVSVALMVFLSAVVTFLFAREVRLSFGSVAATASMLILFAFYRRNGGLGLVLTENLGFLFGTAAFAALLRGVRLRDTRSYVSGAVALTAALMARAGSFFVLPALVATAFVFLRDAGGRRRGGAALLTLGAIALSIAVLFGWGRAMSNPVAGHAAFSNYSQVLYGIVAGGKGWTQVYIDHPNAKEGSEIYALAYEEFRADPSGVIKGMAKMAQAYVRPTEPFAFVEDGAGTNVLQGICYWLALAGVCACVWQWRDPVHALVLAAAIGHLISVPLVPAGDAGPRVYAATMPILALLVAAGVSLPRMLLGHLRRHRANGTVPSQSAGWTTNRLPESAALTLLGITLVGSSALFATGRSGNFIQPSCPSGSESLVVRVDHHAVLRVESDGAPRGVSPNVVRQTELQHTAGTVEMRNDDLKLPAGTSLLFTYDLDDGRKVWLIGESGRFQTRSPWLQICGHYTQDETARHYGLLFVDEARDTEPARSVAKGR